MENSSHALLIAGGILIAVMTLSIFAMLFHNLAKIGEAQALKAEAQELKEWNQQWEAYNKEYLYYEELITLINKAKNTQGTEYKVTIELTGEGGTIKSEEDNALDRVKALKKIQCRLKCTSIGYDLENGRVNKMTFELQRLV